MSRSTISRFASAPSAKTGQPDPLASLGELVKKVPHDRGWMKDDTFGHAEAECVRCQLESALALLEAQRKGADEILEMAANVETRSKRGARRSISGELKDAIRALQGRFLLRGPVLSEEQIRKMLERILPCTFRENGKHDWACAACDKREEISAALNSLLAGAK